MIEKTHMPNPINPNAAIAKVGMGIEPTIFMLIKTIKARLSPTAHFPERVVSLNVFLFSLPLLPEIHSSLLRLWLSRSIFMIENTFNSNSLALLNLHTQLNTYRIIENAKNLH